MIFQRITLSLNVINNSKKIILWLNKKCKSEKFKRLKIQGKKIPFNNLNKKKTTVYKIVVDIYFANYLRFSIFLFREISFNSIFNFGYFFLNIFLALLKRVFMHFGLIY